MTQSEHTKQAGKEIPTTVRRAYLALKAWERLQGPVTARERRLRCRFLNRWWMAPQSVRDQAVTA